MEPLIRTLDLTTSTAKERQTHHFVKRLVDLGYTVTLAPEAI
jgi:hypothetical protein